jgi:putative transposase
MLDKTDVLSIRKQAKLLDINRSSVYYKPVMNRDSEIANLIQEIYLDSDCRYGYRKVSAVLQNSGCVVNNKKVLKLMQEMNLQGLYPRKFINTSARDLEHKTYPYLLEGLDINKANQVWATDITYIKILDRFMYFVAIIDIYSRYIVSYDLSHTLDASFCVAALKEALREGIPEIFNSDQGCQFTSEIFIKALVENGVNISMDHKGRCFDNIIVERLWRTLKQEAIYYYRPETIKELEICLRDFVLWYNTKRVHQSLKYRTPEALYFNCN